MSDNSKHNLLYFESSSVRELYDSMQDWQHATNKRLLSISVERDGDKFCCIALTNPSEVVITNRAGTEYAEVSYGKLHIT